MTSLHACATRAPARAVGRLGVYATAWRPETASTQERQAVRDLGSLIREQRRKAGLTQAQLAVAAGVGQRHVQRLERGQRLTRRSTLDGIAACLSADVTQATALTEHWLRSSGVELASESDFAERVDLRRSRRQTELVHNDHSLVSVARVGLIGGATLERHVTDRPDGRRRVRRVIYVVVDVDGTSREVEPTADVLAAFEGFPIKWSHPTG